MGIMTANLVNVHIPKGRRHARPRDFMPDFRKTHEPMSVEQMMANAKMFVGAHNAAEKERRRRMGVAQVRMIGQESR